MRAEARAKWREIYTSQATQKSASTAETRGAVDASGVEVTGQKVIKSSDVYAYLVDVPNGATLRKELDALLAEANAIKLTGAGNLLVVRKNISQKRREIASAIKDSKVYKNNAEAKSFVDAVNASMEALNKSLKLVDNAFEKILANHDMSAADLERAKELFPKIKATIEDVYHTSIDKIAMLEEGCSGVLESKEAWDALEDYFVRISLEQEKIVGKKGCALKSGTILLSFIQMQIQKLETSVPSAFLRAEASMQNCGNPSKAVARDLASFKNKLGTSNSEALNIENVNKVAGELGVNEESYTQCR